MGEISHLFAGMIAKIGGGVNETAMRQFYAETHPQRKKEGRLRNEVKSGMSSTKDLPKNACNVILQSIPRPLRLCEKFSACQVN
jgi:hypothetical protein